MRRTVEEAPGQEEEEVVSPEFFAVRVGSYRASGVVVKVNDSREYFLPVEHIDPRVEAFTPAIRERIRECTRAGKLMVRDIGNNQVSMLSKEAHVRRTQEIQARRIQMDEGIAVLRTEFDKKRFMHGKVSSVSEKGAYVCVLPGKDAFVSKSELPVGVLPKAGAEDQRPNFKVGQGVQFRIIRYDWDRDTFYASMLDMEESIARAKAARAARGDFGGGATSAPPAAEAIARPEVAPKSITKRLVDKGFHVVDAAAAAELNAWLKEQTEEKNNKGNKKKALAKTAEVAKEAEKSFIVNVVKGMTSKCVGQLTVGAKAEDKEIKDGALKLVLAEGTLAAGQQHKGVTILKNIITVKA